MWNTIKKLFWISRPISWPNTAYPYAAGYLLSGGGFDAVFWIGTIFFLIPYNLLMYGINDVFDYESDIKNPRKGGIEGMREQRAFHPTIVKASIAITVPFLVALFVLGSLVSSLILVMVVFMVIAYSAAHLRFKERPVLDSITSSCHFVGPLVFALAIMAFPSSAWVYVIAFFLWGMASHAFGAVQDIVPDRQGKLASIATVFGASRTVWFAVVCYTFAAGMVIYQGLPVALIGIAGLLYIGNILPYLFISDKLSGTTNVGWRRFLVLNYVTGAVVTVVLLSLTVW